MKPIDDLLIAIEPETTPCPYLAGHTARMENYVVPDPKPETFDRMIEAGFRHFGVYFFRPACPGAAGAEWCGACVPIRVDCAAFRPSRSQRRVLKRNRETGMRIGAPEYSREKYELYLKHKTRFRDAIENTEDTEEAFQATFYRFPVAYTRECVYLRGGKLAGVSFLDVSGTLASSIYMFFDPEAAELSLGVYSVLREIEHARELGLRHYYLGYWIQGNRFMRYKADYQPAEVHDGVSWRAPGAGERKGEGLCTARWARLTE